MLIVSQCGTGVFNMAHFVGAWIKHYGKNVYLLKALFRNKEVVLGTFATETDARNELSYLIDELRKNFCGKTYDIGKENCQWLEK